MGDRSRARGSAPTRHDSAVEHWASRREPYLDNLKVILIAAIITGHAILGYAESDWWPYADVREVTLSPVTVIVLSSVVLPFAVFVVPLLFLVAGLLTPPSLERKGPGRFARDRMLRLGVPFAVFAVLLWPLLEYALLRELGRAPGLRTYLIREGSLDTGVLWFVGALLVFSLSYAGWVWARRGVGRPRLGAVTAGHLLGLSAVVTIVTFLVRLLVPFEGDNRYVDLNMYEWPACAALFGLGISAVTKGWLTAIPDRLRRQSRMVTLVAVAGFAAFVALGTALDRLDDEAWTGGWHWSALGFTAGESTISVFGPVWLLGVAQRRLDRPLRWAGSVASRSAYGAFLVQGLVLLGLAIALRPLPLPAEVKAVVVAGGSVTGSFALAWLLISRVPGVARVL